VDLLSAKLNKLSKPDIRKVMNSARGEKCQIELPGCCHDPETTVFAHLSSKRITGGGMGTKGKPIGSYACNRCHDVIDGRVNTDLDPNWVWERELEGCVRTVAILLDKGILTVS